MESAHERAIRFSDPIPSGPLLHRPGGLCPGAGAYLSEQLAICLPRLVPAGARRLLRLRAPRRGPLRGPRPRRRLALLLQRLPAPRPHHGRGHGPHPGAGLPLSRLGLRARWAATRGARRKGGAGLRPHADLPDRGAARGIPGLRLRQSRPRRPADDRMLPRRRRGSSGSLPGHRGPALATRPSPRG